MIKTLNHECNKEVEIMQIRDDIGYIKKAIAGNGEEGLIKKVEANRDFRIKAEANLKLIRYLIAIGALNMITSIVTFFR